MKTIRFHILMAVLGWAFMAPQAATAQDDTYKGALIYQFTRLVEWGETGADFRINTVGNTPVKSVLEDIATKKKVGTASISVGSGEAMAGSPKIIFIANEAKGQLDAILAQVKGKGVLVVTESAGLGAKGSPINFIKKDGKVQFEINKASFGASGLKLPLALERLATKVH